MITFYFSGTGNSKYIAELFAQNTNSACLSIDEKTDFSEIIAQHGTIAFCYPIYGSCVPRIMREFVSSISQLLHGKKIIIFCTQFLFSGDGARAFSRLLPSEQCTVIYTEHFRMPNNISNFALFPIAGAEKQKKYFMRAEKKMKTVCENIEKGIVKKRGFSFGSRLLGILQNSHFPAVERKAAKDVRVRESCIGCGVCVKICPMDNLSLENKTIKPKGNCTLCYRCVNICPNKSITVLVHGKVRKQYRRI